MKKTFLSIFFTLFIATIIVISGPGCANIVPPTGGPRDSLPPVLVNTTPKDSTLNFKGTRITLTFNEYIDLKDVQQNLLFTPLFEKVPVIEARLKTVSIRIRDSLEPNTTYTFNFGSAITDVNEGNPLENFTYTFSTGPYLDSLEISGKVILAESGKVDSTISVILHSSLTDSAVVKQRPRYATKLDNAGNFTFRNLPRDTFAIYALGDAGTLRRYTSPSQYFAFSDSLVISGSSTPVTLYAYKEEDKQTKPGARAGAPGEKRLKLTLNLNNNQQDLLNDLTIGVERPLRTYDSAKMQLSTDSTFIPVTDYTTALDSTRKEIRLKTKWKEGTLYNLVLDKDFAEDTLGRKLLKTDTVSFTTRSLKEYGGISIKLNNFDTAQHPLMQLIQNNEVLLSTPVSSGVFSQTLFQPGEYEVRVIYDKNQNGKWDPGQFFGVRRQPEIVLPIDQKITVKPDAQNEFTIEAPK